VFLRFVSCPSSSGGLSPILQYFGNNLGGNEGTKLSNEDGENWVDETKGRAGVSIGDFFGRDHDRTNPKRLSGRKGPERII